MKKLLILFLFILVLSKEGRSQSSKDSYKEINPMLIPDTQRTPPKPQMKVDTSSKKLKGGALIDTVTPKKQHIPPKPGKSNSKKPVSKPNSKVK